MSELELSFFGFNASQSDGNHNLHHLHQHQRPAALQAIL